MQKRAILTKSCINPNLTHVAYYQLARIHVSFIYDLFIEQNKLVIKLNVRYRKNVNVGDKSTLMNI